MARVVSAKTRQAILALGSAPDAFQLPENWELFDHEGNPIHVSGLSALPPGGEINQVLAKLSSESFDFAWVTPTGGGGGAGMEVYEQLDEPDTTTVGAIWIQQEPS